MTHGSKSKRQRGSIGSSATPARVFPGLKMAGHMGNERKKIRKLEVRLYIGPPRILGRRSCGSLASHQAPSIFLCLLGAWQWFAHHACGSFIAAVLMFLCYPACFDCQVGPAHELLLQQHHPILITSHCAGSSY